MSTRSNLLKILEKNKGGYVSGQELADDLDVSRTAVWKAIKELQNDGYSITATTNKGYSLSPTSDILSSEAIVQNGAKVTDADYIHIYKEVDSTNNEAKRLIMEDKSFGTIIFAQKQNSGKGRRGRAFSSPAGDSIYVSFILEPLLDVKDSLLITVAASVAVARAVEQIGILDGTSLNPKIKWVNDVYLENKKICGILTEAVSDVESGQIQSLVLGIGLNVNININDFPKDLKNIVGTVNTPPGRRNKFAALIINEVFRVQKEINQYASNRSDEPVFMDEYRQRSMILGNNIYIIRDEERIEAKAIDIDRHGGLWVRYKNGKTELLNTGEISIRIND